MRSRQGSLRCIRTSTTHPRGLNLYLLFSTYAASVLRSLDHLLIRCLSFFSVDARAICRRCPVDQIPRSSRFLGATIIFSDEIIFLCPPPPPSPPLSHCCCHCRHRPSLLSVILSLLSLPLPGGGGIGGGDDAVYGLCVPCAVATARNRIDGSSWCVNLLCLNVCAARSIIRHGYGIKVRRVTIHALAAPSGWGL